MKTAVIYTRVSTLRQVEDGHSLDAQEQEVLQYAKHKGMDVLRVFREEGKSGKNNDREELQEMLAFVKQNQVEKLLVYKLSRLSRRVSGLLQIIEELSAVGTHVEFITENIDTATPMGKMITTLAGAFAEMERENILEFSKMGMISNAKAGRHNGGTMTGYKSKEKELVIDDSNNVVSQVFEMYAINSYGLLKIAGILNAQGLKTINNKSYTPCIIASILANERYIGNTVWTDRKLKKSYRKDGTHEPIITKELWDKAQELRKLNRTVARNYYGDYLITGLLRCPNCGARMFGASQRGYRYYGCSSALKLGSDVCSTHLVVKEKIEEEVIEGVINFVNNEGLLKEIIAKTNESNEGDASPLKEQIAKLEKELKKLEKERIRLYEDKLSDKISLDNLNKFMSYIEKKEFELKKQKIEAEQELRKFSFQIDETATIEYFNSVKNIRELSSAEQKTVIRAVVESVEIHDGDSPKERTLARINFRFSMENVFGQRG